ncbi:MAG TPA: hypothetical protein VGV17_07765 [Bosea sp. (in: a-proteobacteria)]|jgi:hypothetical protein|uniref:hypothetical protein n=1 Tax=Bosea sp. (in: a-proteobacteria) TaxID=1871050 RepID=UPI002DDD1F4A|nr:hypothetical protein [Bosea sp. (in: a-proteobacteria)]HEV2553637.1 hypothetical protein [Bosea sp. (in: a-proteobacteria)]
MRYDSERDWIDAVARVALDHLLAPLDQSGEIAKRLIQLHMLMLDAPRPVHNQFVLLTERALDECMTPRINDYLAGKWAWEIDAKAELPIIVLTIAAEIRALDRHLVDYRRDKKGSPFESRIEVGDAWVLLSRGPMWREKLVKQGEPYRRRGMLHHRAVPMRVGGYIVTLAEVADPRVGGRGDDNKLAAAMVHGLELHPSIAEGKFSITDITAPAALQSMEAQVDLAAKANCWVLAWPELSVSAEVRRELAKSLLERSIDKPMPPAVIVAGSSHEVCEKGRVNRAHILTKSGDKIAHHEKAVPYFEASEWGIEDIDSGNEIAVLVSRGPSFAVAICKDFCDRSQANPYVELDVDLIVVPSMGRETTAASHVHAAQDLKTKAGATVFVVQQSDPYWDRSLNYVISPATDLDMGAAACVQGSTLSVHRWTRPEEHPT